MIVCGLRIAPFSFVSRRPSQRVLRTPTTYLCSKRECSFVNPPQAATGRFACQGTLPNGGKCTGTYRVTRWEVRTYERTVRAQYAAEDIQRRKRQGLQSSLSDSGSDASSASCYSDDRSSDSAEGQKLLDRLRARKAERSCIRRVLDAWYQGDDAALVAYVKAIGHPELLSSGKQVWLAHVHALMERETALTEWIAEFGASCAGEESWTTGRISCPR